MKSCSKRVNEVPLGKGPALKGGKKKTRANSVGGGKKIEKKDTILHPTRAGKTPKAQRKGSRWEAGIQDRVLRNKKNLNLSP